MIQGRYLLTHYVRGYWRWSVYWRYRRRDNIRRHWRFQSWWGVYMNSVWRRRGKMMHVRLMTVKCQGNRIVVRWRTKDIRRQRCQVHRMFQKV